MKRRRFNSIVFSAAVAAVAVVGGIWLHSCKKTSSVSASSGSSLPSPANATGRDAAEPNLPADWNRPRTEERLEERAKMVEWMERHYGLDDPAVLEAMRQVPRHWFVPAAQRPAAYVDSPLPIGHGQTISQPFIVAYMTSVLDLDPNDRVLEIGTGSGYQAAVLNEFTPHVFTIEIVRPLAERAIETFKQHGYSTIRVRIGDGYQGWPEYAPFDAIIVTCAPNEIPPPLLEQLRPDGRMIIPVGGRWGLQELILVEKDKAGKITRRSVMPVRFVPLIREAD